MSVTYAWGDKQIDTIDAIVDGDDTQIVVAGPLQCGKSVSTSYGFFGRAALKWSGYDFIVATRSQRQMTGTVLKYMREFAQDTGVWLNRRDGYWEMESLAGKIPNRFYTLLGTNEASESRARSFTVAGVLAEEATLLPDSFLKQLVARASVPGALVLLNTNTDAPSHPVKANWIDRGVKHFPFELADNHTLTDEYIESLKRQYQGFMRERMVYGKWVAAEGMIYPNVTIEAPPQREADFYILGADWAHSSTTHVVLIGSYGPQMYAEREWVHNGASQGQLNELEQARRIKRELVGNRKLKFAVSDPSAPRFRKALTHHLGKTVKKADNDVPRGIQYVRACFEDETLKISPRCEKLIAEQEMYRWDEKAAILGEDKPVKKDDHGLDALRYIRYSYASAVGRKSLSIERGSARPRR